MNKKLFLDDFRNPPDNTWDIARTYKEAIDLLSTKQYDTVSLDHDLGDFHASSGREYTGYDVLLWLVEESESGRYVPRTILVHTANPPAGIKMRNTIARYFHD